MKNEGNSVKHSIYNTLATNAMNGYVAGFIVGWPVGFPEALKVKRQTHVKKQIPISASFSNPTYANQLKNSFSVSIKDLFSPIFDKRLGEIGLFANSLGIACAIELSVIDEMASRLKSQGYSDNTVGFAACSAAAISGAAWLTPADHLFFRSEKKEKPLTAIKNLYQIRPTAFFVGYTPMIVREFIFDLAHFWFAARLGKFFYNNYVHPEAPLSDKEKLPKNFEGKACQAAGNAALGVPAAIATQIFDVTKTLMQAKLFEGTLHPRMLNVIAETWQMAKGDWKTIDGIKRGVAPFCRGMMARTALATFGGTAIKQVYDHLDERTKQPSKSFN